MNADEPAGERPAPRLERVHGGRARLPLGPGLLILALAVAFLSGLGLGLGGRGSPAPSPTTPSPGSANASPAPPPAVVGGQVSEALWTAYLDRGFNGPAEDGWALCHIEATITCQPIVAVPAHQLPRFALLPLFVPPEDWSSFAPVTMGPGRYVLAAPMTLIGPDVSFARIAADGGGTLIGPAVEATWNGTLWADFGTLAGGRYAAVVMAYDFGDVDRPAPTSPVVAWGLGFVIGP